MKSLQERLKRNSERVPITLRERINSLDVPIKTKTKELISLVEKIMGMVDKSINELYDVDINMTIDSELVTQLDKLVEEMETKTNNLVSIFNDVNAIFDTIGCPTIPHQLSIRIILSRDMNSKSDNSFIQMIDDNRHRCMALISSLEPRAKQYTANAKGKKPDVIILLEYYIEIILRIEDYVYPLLMMEDDVIDGIRLAVNMVEQ